MYKNNIINVIFMRLLYNEYIHRTLFVQGSSGVQLGEVSLDN